MFLVNIFNKEHSSQVNSPSLIHTMIKNLISFCRKIHSTQNSHNGHKFPLPKTGPLNTGANEPPKTGIPLAVEVAGDMDDAVSLLIKAGPPNTGGPNTYWC